jgi:hypothetical protein
MSWFIEHLHRDGTVMSRLKVNQPQLTIGRALDNGLILDDIHCAPYHARLHIHPDGRAELIDLDTRNGIITARGKRVTHYTVEGDQPVRLGQSTLRVRSMAWPLAPEQALSTRRPWVWALLAMAVVMAYTVWTIWLGDVNEKSPPYLYGASGILAGFALWSTLYALLGRLISGVDRFFSHVLVACCGYMAGVICSHLLDALSFASGWLWPVQMAQYIIILVVALTVRAHLRLADPRHWPVMRWGIAVITLGALLVPLAQLWISSHRLTRIQVLGHIEHPALLLATPTSAQALMVQAQALKDRADQARTLDVDEDVSEMSDD